jgi:carbonic anhydrase
MAMDRPVPDTVVKAGGRGSGPDPGGGLRFVSIHEGGQRSLVEVRRLTGDYFRWMDGEISRVCGLSIPDMVGMDMTEYVGMTMDGMCAVRPPEGLFLIVEDGAEAVGMGGLRRLPDGAAEIVRIYTDPAHRGRGIGARTVAMLVERARAFGYRRVKLDTGTFMTSAQRIYSAAGFTPIDPYEGAEPPAVLHPHWLYMSRDL